MKRPLRGLLIGPLVVPLAYWLGIMAYACSQGRCAGVSAALRELGAILLFGLALTYLAVLVWGAPVVFVLRGLGRLRPVPLVVAGALGGTLLAVLLGYLQEGGLFRVRLPLLAGAALGALCAAACWHTGRGSMPARDEPVTSEPRNGS